MVNTLTMKFPCLRRLALLSLILTGWGFSNVAAQAQQIVRPPDNGIDERGQLWEKHHHAG